MSTTDSRVPARHPQDDPGLLRVLGDDGTVSDPALDPELSVDLGRAILESMLRARWVDERVEKLQRQGRVAFHVSAKGEEAAVVASAAALASEDWIVPCYREVGALLHRGHPLERYLDSLIGNADDVALGHQMPEHVTARALRYASVSAPIGTQIPHAVGIAYARRLRGARECVAVYFGDGATSSNDFHAGMTLAGVWKAPVLFLCRNNRWAISLPVEEQTAAAHLVDKAIGYGIVGVRCDGNDPLAVYRTVREARRRALDGGGPTFVELCTYREGGHSTSDDPSAYRSEQEAKAFEARDPLPRFRAYLESRGAWSVAHEQAFRARVDSELKEAIERAEQKPRPALHTLVDAVFAERPASLDAQLAELEHGPRPRLP